MKTLLLLRHAKSSWDNPHLDDFERPLNKRGRKTAKRVGKYLVEQDLVPGLIVSSPARRARKTARRVAKKSGYSQKIELDKRLYLSDVASHLAVVDEFPPGIERVLLVGHNPGLSDFLKRLTDLDEELSTAALARVELDIANWAECTAETRGRLAELWRPRELHPS
jgi:phosphohistidine phosphatase